MSVMAPLVKMVVAGGGVLVLAAVGLNETVRLSMASPSSEPASSVSAQRRNNSCPGCTTTPVNTTFAKTCRLAAALPSNAAELTAVILEVKFSAFKLVHAAAENEFVMGELPAA